MRDRAIVLVYAIWVLVATSVHDVGFLAGALAVLIAMSGTDALRIARRSVGTFLWFTVVVSLSYGIASLSRGGPSWSYLALLNFRILVLTWSAFLLAARVDVVRALAVFPTLAYLLGIARGQIVSLRRVVADYRDALRSRTIGPIGLRDLYRQRAAICTHLVGRALRDATEITQAMRSRGFFDDQA